MTGQAETSSKPGKKTARFFPALVFLGLFAGAGYPVFGAEADSPPPPPASRAALLTLARQFVDRVGGGMAKADEAMGLKKKGVAGQPDFSDGMELILQARLGRHVFPGDMIAVYEGGRVFVSLKDFFAVLGFPLRVDTEKKQAEGWFIRETKPFRLDETGGRVSVGEKNWTLDPSTTRWNDDDWSVALDTLADWFDVTLDLDVVRQSISISSAEPLPVQDRAARRSRRVAQAVEIPPAKLPRQETPPRLVDTPFVDAMLNAQIRRSRTDQPYSRNASYSVFTSGDLAGMTMKSFSASDLRDGLNSVRLSAIKTSEDADLLGPVQAREIEIGDISPVGVPLLGNSGQEQGIRLTNRKADQPVHFAATTIDGDAQPGWDVELYRGEQIAGFQEVDSNGRYAFENVRLLAGDNDFRLVFYGLNGERREEKRKVTVDLNAAANAGGVWSLSATRRNETTYDRQRSVQPEDGKPQIAATYQKGLGDKILFNAGLRSVPEEDLRKTSIEGGLSTVLGGILLSSNAAVDMDGEAAAELIARRNLGKQRLSAQIQTNTSAWSTEGSAENPTVLDTNAQISGPLFSWNGTHLAYGLEGQYSELAENQTTLSASQNLNLAMGPMRFNNALDYEKKTRFGPDHDGENIQDSFSVSYLLGKNQFRASALYEIAPDPAMASVFASWLHKHTRDLSSEVEAERFLESGLSRVEGKINWRHENFTVSPRVEMDSDGRVVAAIGARTGLARDPHTDEPVFRGRTLTGSGGISARVFLDNDGNGSFNTGDEPVEGVKVMAVQSRRRALTNDQGVAFLTDVPTSRATDVILDRESFPDPAWVSASEGMSLLPRPGRADAVDFPLHKSGEIDGTVFLAAPRRTPYPASGIRLHLYDMSGRKKMFSTTAYDGFYLFSMIPPGDYYLLPAPDDLQLLRAESPLPQKIRIGYDGTVLYGQDITLTVTDDRSATVAIAEGPGDYLLRNGGGLPDLSGTRVMLDLGTYRSRLLMALVWYRLKTRYAALLSGSELLVRPSESLPDSGNNHLLRVSQNDNDLEEARRKCRAIAARGIGCRVSFLPSGGDVQAALEEKKGT